MESADVPAKFSFGAAASESLRAHRSRRSSLTGSGMMPLAALPELSDSRRRMRVAFSGTHRSGKSTLLGEIACCLPHYATVDEPYYLLEEDGYETTEKPSIEDFEAQLDRSLVSLEDGGPNVLFDRCPADILAYLLTHDDAASFDTDEWLERGIRAMRTLDLVVFVPVESPDRIAVSAHEDRELRMAVDATLEDLLLAERYAFEVEVLRVHGDLHERARQVIARINVE
jgi:hypothetical protein